MQTGLQRKVLNRFSIYLTIFSFFFAIYLLSMGGHGYGGVGTSVYEVTRNIILKQNFSIKPNPWGRTGLDGKFYSQFGLGHSLYNIPFYLLGHSLCYFNPGFTNQYRRITMFTTLLGQPFITSLTAVLIFIFCLKLGYQKKTSLFLTFIYGLGTMAWPYAKFDFSEPLLCFLILAALVCFFYFKNSGEIKYLFIGSLLLGFGIITKIVIALFIPVAVFYLFFDINKKKIIIFVSPILLGFIAMGLYNFVRFGNIFVTGYKNEFELNFLSYLIKFKGNIIGPNGSIFLYSPVLVVFLCGLRDFFKRHKMEAILFYSIILGFMFFYPLTTNECYYGPRYLLSLMPLMVIPIGEVWEKRKEKRWFRNIFYIIFFVSVMVQLIGVTVNYRLYRWRIELAMPEELKHIDIGKELLNYPDTTPLFGNIWLVKEGIIHGFKPGIIPKSGIDFHNNYEIENAWLPYYGLDIWWLNPHLIKWMYDNVVWS